MGFYQNLQELQWTVHETVVDGLRKVKYLCFLFALMYVCVSLAAVAGRYHSTTRTQPTKRSLQLGAT